MEPKELITAVSLAVALVILAVISGLIVGSIADSSALQCTDLLTSTNDTVLTELTSTLAPIGDGITSSSVIANEFTWLEFDGVNDVVDVGSFNDINNTNFSLSFWVKNENQCGSQDSMIGKNFVYWVYLRNDCNIIFTSRNKTLIDRTIISNQTLINDTWQYIVYTYNGTHTFGYINTSLVGTVNQQDIDDVGNTFHIGGAINGQYFDGSMDEIRVYNDTLTFAQITEIFDSGTIQNGSLPSENLILWYSFNEGSGSTVHDLSGNNNNGI